MEVTSWYNPDEGSLFQKGSHPTVLEFKVKKGLSIEDPDLLTIIKDDPETEFVGYTFYNNICDHSNEVPGVFILNGNHLKEVTYRSSVNSFTGLEYRYSVTLSPGKVLISTGYVDTLVSRGRLEYFKPKRSSYYRFLLTPGKPENLGDYIRETDINIPLFVLHNLGMTNLKFDPANNELAYNQFKDTYYHSNPPDWFWKDPHELQIANGVLFAQLRCAGIDESVIRGVESQRNHLIHMACSSFYHK